MVKSRILIVEDEAVIALDLRSRLEAAGYDVCALATTKEEAVALSGNLDPRLVLMDIRLEGSGSGIEAADEIRIRYKIPVIFLTAYADEGTIERAKVTRPYGYIMKPFKDQELRAAIEIALYRHEVESIEANVPVTLINKDQTIYSPSISKSSKHDFKYATSDEVVFIRLPADVIAEDDAPDQMYRLILIHEGGLYPTIGIEVVGTIHIGRRVPGTPLDLDLSPFDAEFLGVSRQHAMIQIENNSLVIYDIGSTNGTYVNDQRAWLGQPLKLEDGDIIRFGSLAFKIKLPAADYN
jgi:CheY-like chemotaxis protein